MMRSLLNLYMTPEVARDAIEHGATLGGAQVEADLLPEVSVRGKREVVEV